MIVVDAALHIVDTGGSCSSACVASREGMLVEICTPVQASEQDAPSGACTFGRARSTTSSSTSSNRISVGQRPVTPLADHPATRSRTPGAGRQTSPPRPPAARVTDRAASGRSRRPVSRPCRGRAVPERRAPRRSGGAPSPAPHPTPAGQQRGQRRGRVAHQVFVADQTPWLATLPPGVTQDEDALRR